MQDTVWKVVTQTNRAEYGHPQDTHLNTEDGGRIFLQNGGIRVLDCMLSQCTRI